MFYTYFILFIIYSFIGWIGEIVFSIIQLKKAVNRGFLMGPWCPIYGCGCLLLVILLAKYATMPLALFALSILICSLLEYFTSWIMEVIFKMRWWDYSDLKYNINGRICLESIIPFGLIGVLVVMFVNPFLLKLLNLIPKIILNITAVILLAIFILDVIISSNVIFNFKSVIKDSRKDSTEAIKKLVMKKFNENNILYMRLANAFPTLHHKLNKKKRKRKRSKRKP